MTDVYDKGKKAKYWNVIVYPENLNFECMEDASDEIGIPFAYCVHDKDKDGHDGDRKTHVHVMAAFSNTTTAKHVYEMFSSLSKPGRKCCLPPKPCGDVRHSYEYLIHDTENARKKGKHQYGVEERICCNGFDIGLYEQISQEEKDRMAKELCDFALQFGFENMAAYYRAFEKSEWFKEDHETYFCVLKTVNAMIDRICRGNAFEAKRRKQEAKPPKCAWCGSNKVLGKVETSDGYLWFCEADQYTAYVVMKNFEEGNEEWKEEVETKSNEQKKDLK